jgi:uncharacterized protein (TIGR02118 family)
MIKVIGLMRRNPAMTQAQFVEYWKNVHVPLVKKSLPGLIHYVGNFPVIKTSPGGTKVSDYDGIVELGFESVAAAEAAMSNPAFLSEDRQISSATLMDMSRTESIVTEEIVIPL